MKSDHKETSEQKKFKYKRLGPIHVMGKYNLARFKGAALRDKIFFQAQVFFAGFDTKLRLKLSRQPLNLVLAHIHLVAFFRKNMAQKGPWKQTILFLYHLTNHKVKQLSSN